MSIRSRLISGFNANFIGQVVNALIQILSVPIFLTFWGPEVYGEWLILYAFVAYFTVSELGISDAAANRMAICATKQHTELKLQIFQTTWISISFISILVLFVITLIVFNIPVGLLLGLSLFESKVYSLVIIIFIIHLLATLQINIMAAGFRSEGMYSTGVQLVNLIRIIEFAFLTIAVVLKSNLLGAALSLTAGRIVVIHQ